MSPPDLLLTQIETPEPIGTISIVSAGQCVLALDFGNVEERLMRLLRARFGADVALTQADGASSLFSSPLHDYFAGDFAALDRTPVDGGGSAFQRRVWAALREIPAGTTRSYGEIATAIDSPGAARAVGLANSLNPINLIVPCHRVIATSGALTGYGGGLERKRWLLDFERGQEVAAQMVLI